MTVHLGYAVDDFHCLLDGELFLPESWSKDRTRCAATGIPDDMVYRPKTDIALELYDRAVANGVGFAPPQTRAPTLLLVGFSRWQVERCFEDGKGEIGLSHYEGRRYLGLKRHLILSAVSYLFLMEGKETLREKKSRMDGVPSPSRNERDHPVLVA